MKLPTFEMLPVIAIKPHPDRLRQCDAEEVYRLRKCIATLGWLAPLVFNTTTNTLLDGDKRLQAAKDLGMKEVPCVVVEVPAEHEMAAHMALQNHVGDWQWQGVSEQLKAMQAGGLDVDLAGFHSRDSGPLLLADWAPAAKGPMDGSDKDQGVLL